MGPGLTQIEASHPNRNIMDFLALHLLVISIPTSTNIIILDLPTTMLLRPIHRLDLQPLRLPK